MAREYSSLNSSSHQGRRRAKARLSSDFGFSVGASIGKAELAVVLRNILGSGSAPIARS